jgi:hypothetical protein
MAERCRHDILEDCPDCLRDTIADLVKALEKVQFSAKAPEENHSWLLRELARQADDILARVKSPGGPDV